MGTPPTTRLLSTLRKVLRLRGQSAADTDDLIQEAFLRLHVYCREHAVDQPEAFLIRTAVNLTIDGNRRAVVRGIVPEPVENLRLVDPAPRPDEVLAAQQRLQRFNAGLRALSPRAREAFLLQRMDGYSYVQIAARLQISVSTVEKHIAKAALFLRNWMDKE